MPDQGGAEWPEEDERAWLAWLEAESESEPWEWDEGAFPDPDSGPPPDADLDAIIAETDQLGAEEAERAARAARLGCTVSAGLGRRGPYQPGSAESFPGVFDGPGGGFASGQVLDSAPADPVLACLADTAAGDNDDYAGVSDDELIGVLCAWERAGAHVAARRYAALAELTRRRPRSPGTPLDETGQLPVEPDEFLSAEVADAMAWTRAAATGQLHVAWELTCRLPCTRQALRDGVIDEAKAKLFVTYTAGLSAKDAARVETLLLGQVAGGMTLGELRKALSLAEMAADPEAAARRRKEAQRDTRVEMRPEFSGNGSLSGRELPPADVLAADQRVTWWACQLSKAGLEGTMGQLRARAYLDLLLGIDSRPGAAGQPREQDVPAGPCDGSISPGFTGQVNLTVPLTTLLGMSERPASLGTFGPIDPDLARNVAAAAARAGNSSWCVTITDDQGHPVGHGCARPGPRTGRPPDGQGTPPGRPHAPLPGGPHAPPGSGFAFKVRGQPGPPGGYGTWQLTVPGRGTFMVALHPIGGDCDHRFEAKGHDPGLLLEHLTEILHPTCTAAGCRRPASQCDYEHNAPFEAGGRTCLCNGDSKCRHDHRRKQDPRWRVERTDRGTLRWTAPSGRTRESRPTRYPV